MTHPLEDVVARLAEIRERVEAATKGPWRLYHGKVHGGCPTLQVDSNDKDRPIVHWMGFDDGTRRDAAHIANATFIAYSREDVPFLLAEIDAARAALTASEERVRKLRNDVAAQRIHIDQLERDAARMQEVANALRDATGTKVRTGEELICVVREMRSQLTEKDARIAELEDALRQILADPYGCRFCDSGKLRNETKSHDPECGFNLAKRALPPSPAPAREEE